MVPNMGIHSDFDIGSAVLWLELGEVTFSTTDPTDLETRPATDASGLDALGKTPSIVSFDMLNRLEAE